MKLNVNKNIISGNNLLPFYFLPHALNISLFICVNFIIIPSLLFGNLLSSVHRHTNNYHALRHPHSSFEHSLLTT